MERGSLPQHQRRQPLWPLRPCSAPPASAAGRKTAREPPPRPGNRRAPDRATRSAAAPEPPASRMRNRARAGRVPDHGLQQQPRRQPFGRREQRLGWRPPAPGQAPQLPQQPVGTQGRKQRIELESHPHRQQGERARRASPRPGSPAPAPARSAARSPPPATLRPSSRGCCRRCRRRSAVRLRSKICRVSTAVESAAPVSTASAIAASSRKRRDKVRKAAAPRGMYSSRLMPRSRTVKRSSCDGQLLTKMASGLRPIGWKRKSQGYREPIGDQGGDQQEESRQAWLRLSVSRSGAGGRSRRTRCTGWPPPAR